MFITIIKCLLLSKFITDFAPINWLLDLLPNNLFKYISVLLTTCFKCAAFHITLLYTGDIFIASAASFIAYVYTQLEHNIQFLWIKYLNKNNK